MQVQLVVLLVCSILVSVLIGKLSQKFWGHRRILLTRKVQIICLGISSLAVAPLTTVILYQTDHYQRLTFHEYYNGVETGTEAISTVCQEDGLCVHTYPCHYYTVHHPGYYTGTGEDRTYHPGYDEVRHHDCPYSQQEQDWVIHSTVGDFVVAQHRFPSPVRPWDQAVPIPQSVLDDAGVGIPPEITIAQQRIDQGDPRPATKIDNYINYILASDNVLVRVPDDQVIKYHQANLLPSLTSNIVDVDQANKVHFVGFSPPDVQAWQDAMMRLNMEAGSLSPVTTRFDIQLVCINSATIPEASANGYTTALNAYWESSVFGKAALPKNMAVVVIGTDGKTVSWARGFTLIPTGNGTMWSDLQDFAPGTAFTPQALIGEPRAQLSRNASGAVGVTIVPTQGELEMVLIRGPHHFVRQHMTDRHAGSVGYQFLEGDIQPSFWTCVCIFLVTVLITGIVCNLLFLFAIAVSRIYKKYMSLGKARVKE
jgi:hypothetical protein